MLKRTRLKQGNKPLKRTGSLRKTPLRRQSNAPPSQLIRECDKLISKIIIAKRGRVCQICGGTEDLGVAHILNKESYERLRYHEKNLVVMGWWCCHIYFDSDLYVSRKRIIPKIKDLLGEDYEEQLKLLNKTAPQINRTRLILLHVSFKQMLG